MLKPLKTYWTAGDPLVRASQLAQGLRQLTLIALALLLPRMSGLVRADIGLWEQFQYIGYVLGFAWLAGLGQAYLAEVKQGSAQRAALLSRQVMRLSLGISVGIGLLFIGLESPLLQFFSGQQQLPGWMYYLLFLLTHWPYLMYEQVLIAQGRAKRLLWVAVLSNATLGLAILLPLLLGYTWQLSLSCLCWVALLKALLLLLDRRLWLDGNLEAEVASVPALRPSASQLLRVSLPLMGYAVLGTLVVSLDPWLVNYWYGGDADQFAIYRYGTRELPFLMAVTNGINQAVLPALVANRTLGLAQLKASTLRLMHLIFPLLLLLLLTSPWWWAPLFTDRFAAALPLFQVFVLVGVSRVISPIVVLTAMGHRKALLGIGLLELVLNIALSYWLLFYFGLIGIVWATVIVYTSDKLLAAYYLYRSEGVSLGQYCNWRILLGYASLCLLALLWVWNF